MQHYDSNYLEFPWHCHDALNEAAALTVGILYFCLPVRSSNSTNALLSNSFAMIVRHDSINSTTPMGAA